MDFLQHLILRVNRTLGVALQQEHLLSSEGLSQANDQFLEAFRGQEWETASLLPILTVEARLLPESVLIGHQIENHRVPYLHPTQYYGLEGALSGETLRYGMATRTLPFDRVDGVWFLCTATYLSKATRAFWESHLDGELVWYAAHLAEIESGLKEQAVGPDAVAS